VNQPAAPPPAALAAPSAANLGGPRYFAWLYSPPGPQERLQILFEIETELRAVLKPGMAHQVAHVRLEWWRAEIERAAAGNPVHPLTRALLPKLSDHSRAALLDGLLDTTVWDLASAPFGTRAEVAGYCERWASAMSLHVAEAKGTPGKIMAAVREIELLVDLHLEAHAGRLRLPLDELEREGVDPEALAKPPWPAKLSALLEQRHRALREALASSAAMLSGEEQTAMRGLLVWAGLAARRSKRVVQALPGAFPAGGAANLGEAWSAWRLARAASKGQLRIHPE
jgi:15-cis-phytoene synthase